MVDSVTITSSIYFSAIITFSNITATKNFVIPVLNNGNSGGGFAYINYHNISLTVGDGYYSSNSAILGGNFYVTVW